MSISKFLSRILPILLIGFLIYSCGIHFNVQNPRHEGKYPKFSQETCVLGANTLIRKNFDVNYYNIDVTLDYHTKTIGGWVEIKATALNDIDSVQLDLDQPFAIEELKLGSRNGQTLNYTRNFRAILIKLPSKMKKDEIFSIYIKYSGKPIEAKKAPWAGGVVWKKDKLKNPWAGVACETDGASVWLPCKDHTSDEPDSVDIRFTIPDTTLSVISNGQFKGVEKSDKSSTFKWKVTYPINVYNISFYVGNFVKISDSYTGISGKKLDISYYALKQNENKARNHFPQVKRHIKTYEEIYGEYSWYNDGFKLIESPYAGMEHQTAIAYGNGYKNDKRINEDYIILHETGHEWFGNAITAADLADVWLQEGITTYGEYLYLQKVYDERVAFTHLFIYRLMIKNKLPLVGPVDKRYFDYHDGDVYFKGAWVLHSLRNTIGNDSIFFTIMRTFYAENKLKVTNSKTFIETVNRITGKDYNWFFTPYLYSSKVPVFQYVTDKEGNIYYKWSEVNDDFNQIKVPVILGGGSNHKIELIPSTKLQVYKTEIMGEKPLNISVDNSKVLFAIEKVKKLNK